MTILGKLYSLDDFSKLIFADQKYVLPDSVFEIFKRIESNIEIPTFTAPTSTSASISRGDVVGSRAHAHRDDAGYNRKGKDNVKGRGKKEPAIPTDDWSMMRSFKATKIEAKTGVDKMVNGLRIQLNKMSATNYTKQRDLLFAEIHTYLQSADESADNTRRISSVIFESIYNNKILSEVYAELYHDLIREFQIFSDLLEEFVAEFHKTIHTIEYVNPEENYDEFCRINKNNDRRKNGTLFICHLMNKGAIPPEYVMAILDVFMGNVRSNIDEPNRTNHIEELTENIYILVSSGFAKLSNSPEWDAHHSYICELSTSQPKQHLSLSNRIVFKFMDILDAIRK